MKIELGHLPKGYRYIGYRRYYYNGDFHCIGIWWFTICLTKI